MRKFRLLILVILVAMAVVLDAAQKDPRAEAQLQAAINKETVEGDLKSAIEMYRKVAQSGNRAVAAKALVRMGQCYEKLGDAEARKAYERVVREFGDQKEAVALAKARLGVGDQAGQQITRLVWTGVRADTESSVSPDGRYLSYVDWDTGDLALHEIATGLNRRLTNKGTWDVDEFAEESAISRDGKQVAYTWFSSGTKDRAPDQLKRGELRLASLTGDPKPRRLYDNPDIHWIIPYDWSPDGKWVSVQVKRWDRTDQIGLVSVQDGSLHVLKSGDFGRGPIFSPDGKYMAYDRPAGGSSQQRDVFVLAVDGNREIPAVVDPNQDEMVGWSPDGKYLLFTSDRTGSTGLWALPFANGTPQGKPELLKADVGRIVPMRLNAAGALYYGVPDARLLSRVQVAAFDFGTGQFLSAPADVAPEGVLESNTSPDWSADGKYLAYISRSAARSENFSIKIRAVETGQVRELRPTLNRPYDLRWAPDGRSFAISQNSVEILRVDADTGETAALVKPRFGYMMLGQAWSPDGKRIYYSRMEPVTLDIAFIELDLASGNERELIRRARQSRLGWGGVNISPDGRYIATTSVDPSTNSRAFLLIPVAGGEPRELMRAASKMNLSFLRWAPDSRSLLIRKNREVWQALLDGSEPRKLNEELDPRLATGGMRMHPDGRQIALETAAGRARPAEVWVLENFLPKAAK